MAKASCRIYQLSYVSQETYDYISPKIKILEEKTSTSVKYDFEEMCFEVSGDTKVQCDKTVSIILNSLIPILNRGIDDFSMKGTFLSVKDLKSNIHYTLPSSGSTDIKDLPNVCYGKPLPEETEGQKEVELVYEEENEELIIKEFNISPKIKHVPHFLIGPVQYNMQNAEYLDLIPTLTGAECSLINDRTIKIMGQIETVQDAYDRFTVIQDTLIGFIDRKIVTCIHYPRKSGHYGLFFCRLDNYKHKDYVHIHPSREKSSANLYVVLPVFPNKETNEYDRPKDLIFTDTLSPRRLVSNQQRQESLNNLTIAMDRVPIHDHNSSPVTPQPTQRKIGSLPPLLSPQPMQVLAASSLVKNQNIPEERFDPPLWGLDRNFTTVYNDGNMSYLSTKRLERAFTPPLSPSNANKPLTMLEDFPVLLTASDPSKDPRNTDSDRSNSRPSSRSSSPYQPMIGLSKPKTRRVMRIVPQKSIICATSPSISLLERVRIFNYNNIKSGLESGLSSLRGFNGEIKMSAKIGKVLWTNISDRVRNEIWKIEDVADILIKELSVQAWFSDITTLNENIFDKITSNHILPTTPFNKTAFYEFHCSARNQPSIPYKPVVIHMNQGAIDIKKVVVSERPVTEINWISLSRKYDFKLSLTAKQLVRRDAKPYSTFIKKVSICPITYSMSFENVENFLTVDYLLYRQTSRYRIVFPFIVEISRVEKVPIQRQTGTKKINAYTGKGQVWYDFEIRDNITDNVFKANLNLEIGKRAHWTVDQILQPNESTDIVTDYVKNLLTIIEKMETALKTSC